MPNQYKKYHDKTLADIQADKKVTRKRAIRAFCLSCVGFSGVDAKDCRGDDNCPLFPFRLGRETKLKSRRTPQKVS